MDTFTYTPLPDAESVRMLTLKAGKDDEPLRGSLNAFNMKKAPKTFYEPLSYVWGKPVREREFLCDGKALKVTSSLYQALQRLRLPEKDRCVWADQICINQDDTRERGEQVRFMNEIYEHANHVLVWLGPDDRGEAEAAFGLVKELAEKFADEYQLDQFRDEHTGSSLSFRSEVAWTPIKHLTRLPWFRRVWVVQEIGTRAPATLYWGGTSKVEWDVLYGVCERLTEFHELRRRFDIDTARIKFFYQRFVPPNTATRHANRLNFVYELHRARELAATDPRDRVFAFLGHYSLEASATTNPELQGLVANYNGRKATLPRVYMNAAARALVRDGGGNDDTGSDLIALAAVQHEVALPRTSHEWRKRRDAEGENYMPSWVPDWRTYTSHIMSEPTSPHRSSGRVGSQSPRPVLAIDEDNGELHIHGFVVDVIVRASEPLQPKAFHKKDKAALLSRLWEEVCDEKSDARGILFDSTRRYRRDGICSSLLAFTQTLSNGGVATALRWYDKRGGEGDEAARGEFYRAIPDEEWLIQGATCLVRALEQAETTDMAAPELQALVDRTPAANVGSGDRRSNGHGIRHNSGSSNGGEGSGPDAEWSRSANGASSNRVFACTETGYYVLGPKVLAPGDVVCVLRGGKMGFCLRPLGHGRYLLVGECYVHGLMNGEIMDMLERGEVQEEELVLV